MNNLTPITREEMLLNDEPLTPITREEKILAGEDLECVTRREYFLKKYRHAGGDVMVEGLSVTENGTYTAPEGKAYSPVEVAVPLPDNAYLLKTASGSLVSFSDGTDLPMPSSICNIDAVQDLHGQDAPWVGGAGKNKLPMTVDGIKAANTDGTWTGNAYVINGITYTILTDSNNNVIGIKANGTASANAMLDLNPTGSLTIPANTTFSLSGCPEGGGGSTYRLYPKGGTSATYDNGSGKLITLDSAITNPFRINVYSGAQVDNIIFYPMIVFANAIDMDFAPYSNICPISGHTGLNAWLRGKNLLPMTVDGIKAANTSGTWSGNTYTYKGIVYTVLTDNNNNITGINADGTSTDIGHFNIDFGGQIPVGNYYANGGVDGGSYDTYDVLLWDGTTGARMTRWDGTTASVSLFNTTTSAEIRVPNITDTLRYRIRIRSGIKVKDITFYPMIRLATETDPTFAPYNTASQTIQVSWQTEAGEVYGGYVDLVSGVLTVTDGYIDLGTCEWLRADLGNGNYRYYNTEISDVVKKPSSTSIMPNIECSHYKNKLPSQYNQAVDGITIYTNGSIQVYDSTKSALTTTDFKTAMDGVQIVYELATPQTYQLTPQQIKSLLGNNNAWCSTGDVDIDYFAKEV